jgi:hypothetical protein
MGKVSALCLFGILALTGCESLPIQDQLTFCDGAKPMRPEKGETARLSDKLVDQIHQHNELGASTCGWEP